MSDPARPARGATDPEPYLITVAFEIEPDARGQFISLVTANAKASLDNEPGCLRFDVLLPLSEDNSEILLYEIYRDRAAFEAHLASAHFLSFDAATRSVVRRKTVRDYRLLPHPGEPAASS